MKTEALALLFVCFFFFSVVDFFLKNLLSFYYK